jgi:oxygen-dependent protoporphyrinogen oxidase
MTSKPLVSVIGGGFSGLTMAYFLNEWGFPVRVYESRAWGGLIQTDLQLMMQTETSANAFMNSSLLSRVAQEIGCELQAAKPGSRKKYIFRKGLSRWPVGPASTLRLAASFLPRLVLKQQSVFPRPLETIQDWCLRVLNREILDYLVGPALQGIYGGSSEALSASLIFRSFFFRKREKNKGSVAPNHGMGEFIIKLQEHLKNKGVELISRSVDNVGETQGPLVLAVPLDELMRLRPEFADPNLQFLDLVRVTAGFDSQSVHKISGYGVLLPEKENFNALGVLANSDIFENRGELYNESWIFAGSKYLKQTDEQIISTISTERSKLLADSSPIVRFAVVRCPKAYVRYDLNLERWLLDRVDLFSDSKRRQWVTGNYLGQIGLTQILQRNENLAREMAECL